MFHYCYEIIIPVYNHFVLVLWEENCHFKLGWLETTTKISKRTFHVSAISRLFIFGTKAHCKLIYFPIQQLRWQRHRAQKLIRSLFNVYKYIYNYKYVQVGKTEGRMRIWVRFKLWWCSHFNHLYTNIAKITPSEYIQVEITLNGWRK